MKIEVDLFKCSLYNITPDEYVLLKLIKEDDFGTIVNVIGKGRALSLRTDLINKGFLQTDGSCKFINTKVNDAKYNTLMDVQSANINFWDWYSIYPIKFGSRVFRATKESSELAKKHKKKYLTKVKTLEAHQLAIDATKAFLNSKNGAYAYLPQLERVINNSMWESWEVFITSQKKDNWQADEI
jgi:hypothetical protein